MSTKTMTSSNLNVRLAALLTALCLLLGIAPVVVLAEEIPYTTQGGDLIVYMIPSSDTIVTEDSVTAYYYNIIKTPKAPDQDMVFKIAFGKAPGINNQNTLLNEGKVKVYSSNDFNATPFYTVPNAAIKDEGKNNYWPEDGVQAGRNGRSFTLTIPANTFAPETTYYLVIDDVGSSGGQGEGSIGKKVAFQFTTSAAGVPVHTCTDLQHYPRVEASGCEDGYQEYWQCTDPDCGKYYSDAEGQNEIPRPEPIMAPHNFITIYSKDPTCTEVGYYTGGNGLLYCQDCNRYFKNNGAEVPEKDVILPALGHDFVDGICTRCGAAESGGEDPLRVLTFSSSNGTSLTEKTTTTLEATPAGGEEPYTYKFIVYNPQTNQWYKIRDFASENTCDWYTGAAGTKTLYVDVKDAEGTVARKELNVTVSEDTTAPLAVSSFVSSKGTALTEKTTTTLRATATGGKTPYTYKFIVYNTQTKQWFKIRDFESGSTCDWYTGAPGTKTLYVDVKDANGTVVRKDLGVTVAEDTSAPLSASYFTSSKGTTLNAGDTTNLVAKATGGSGSGYTYKFIVYNETTKQWYKIQDYSTKSSASWYTGAAGTKTLYVDIKDSAGNYVRTPLNVTVR